MAKKPVPVVSEHSASQNKVAAKNAAKSAAPKPIALPPVLAPGAIPTPGRAYVPYEPGMGAGPGGTGGPAAPDTGGDGGTPGDTNNPPVADVDWADVYFGQYGLPADLKNQIIELGKKYGTTNPSVFFQSAQNLIRASDWFAGVFPGFAAGVKAGLFTDETGYRGYVNQLDQVYRQYLGRAVSGAETSAALGAAATPDLVGRQFQGDAIANVNAGQWQYVTGAFDETGALTAAEKTALGREQAGIDTPLGQMVSKRVQLAMGRAQALFSGTLATPSLSLVNGRLSAPSLGASGTPDIAA